MNVLIFAIVAILNTPILSVPINDHSLVVRSADLSDAKEFHKEGSAHSSAYNLPQIYEMTIKSNISNRFAHTTVTSKVRNYADKPQETIFSIILPDSAFISGFIMEIDGKNYTAYVKEKEEAKRTYDAAVSSGLSAGHVAVSARDSNRFSVYTNIEPQKKVAFYLTYEQLLNRRGGRYEQIINIHPGQTVEKLSVKVFISESRKIIDLKAPPLRTGNEIGKENLNLDPRADIYFIDDNTAVVEFNPNVERQKELAHIFGTKEENGLAGQFVVQYDVERDPHGGEVLIRDGYFVHFFAPSNLKPLPKQVVFILDTSGSMWGDKIKQLREAMIKILDQLNEQDAFNLVEFNSNIKVWDINNNSASVLYPGSSRWSRPDNSDTSALTLDKALFPKAYSANKENIEKAKKTVEKLSSSGSTNMYTALEVGLHLVEIERTDQTEVIKRQPIVIFLTDGEPTDYGTEQIISKVSEFNSDPRKSPIFALSFGRGADKKFLENLSLRNSGFARHIYEAADASLQLQDFYKQISSPLLSDVKFQYESSSVKSLTKTEFPIHFGGSEIIISGLCDKGMPLPTIDGFGKLGRISLKPVIYESPSNIERLWAYLTIRQLLEKSESSSNEINLNKKKALDIALKYSFVTSVSSLVVVKPNDTKSIDTEEAIKSVEGHRGTTRQYQKHVLNASARTPSVHSRISRPNVPLPQGMEVPVSRDAMLPLFRKNTLSIKHIMTTDSPLKSASTRSPLDTLFDILPWLKNILTDGFVKVPTGNYKLGLNETLSDKVSCERTPFNQEGHCSLLHACPQVHSALKLSTDFFDHFCVLQKEFAGICCPNE